LMVRSNAQEKLSKYFNARSFRQDTFVLIQLVEGLASLMAMLEGPYIVTMGTAKRFYLSLVFLAIVGCSTEKVTPSTAQSGLSIITTTFEKLIAGEIPTGPFEFKAVYYSKRWDSKKLKEFVQQAGAAPFTGNDPSLYKFIDMKPGIVVPDAADGETLILVAGKREKKPGNDELKISIVVNEIRRP
jgi:hypothetical protein